LDIEFKDPETLGEKYLTVEPDILSYDLTPDVDFIIIACDGLWDVISNERAVTLVNHELELGTPQESIAQKLVAEAYENESGDNITAIIVFPQKKFKKLLPKLEKKRRQSDFSRQKRKKKNSDDVSDDKKKKKKKKSPKISKSQQLSPFILQSKSTGDIPNIIKSNNQDQQQLSTSLNSTSQNNFVERKERKESISKKDRKDTKKKKIQEDDDSK